MIKIFKVLRVNYVGGSDKGTSQSVIGFNAIMSGMENRFNLEYEDIGNNAEYESSMSVFSCICDDDFDMIHQLLDEYNDMIQDGNMFVLDYVNRVVLPIKFTKLLEEK